MAKKVFIAVGHGGSDPGAVGNGLKEKDLNLVMALEFNRVLTEHGVTTLMSRCKDENDAVLDEIAECNNFSPDIAVAVHVNAGGGDGVETFHSGVSALGKTVAENIVDEIKKLGQNSRGAKVWLNSAGTLYHGFIRLTEAPAVIVELAFIDNAEDIKFIDTVAEQKAAGVALAKAVLKVLEIEYIEPAVEKPSAEKWYKVQVGAFKNPKGAETLKKELEAKGYKPFVVET